MHEQGKLGAYWANMPHFGGMYIMCMAYSDHYPPPPPPAGTFNYLNWVGEGTEGGDNLG